MESKIAGINALMRKIGNGELTAIAIDTEDHITAESIPKEVRNAVARAVYGVLEAKREAIRQENARRLLVEDARNFRAIIEFPPNDTLEISDGERTVSVSGELAVRMLQDLKERAVAKLELTLESLAAFDDDEEGDDDGE